MIPHLHVGLFISTTFCICVGKNINSIVQNIQVCLEYLLLIFSNYPHISCAFAFMPSFISRPRDAHNIYF